MPTTTTSSSVWPIRSPRKVTLSVTLTSRVRISVPQNHWIAERIRKARPIDISISCRKPAPFGPHRPPHHPLGEQPEQRRRRHREEDRRDQRHAPGDVDQVGHVGAEGEEVPVGEVDQPQDPVDEGQPDRAERIDHPEGQPVERRLRDVVEPIGGDQDQHDQPDHPERDRRGALPAEFPQRLSRRTPRRRGSRCLHTGEKAPPPGGVLNPGPRSLGRAARRHPRAG